MKRYGHLLEKVHDFGNLLTAFQRARRGSGWTAQSEAFFFHLEAECLRLQEQLASGTYQPSPYRCFHIQDPKPRTISVAPFRDRVVHHALVAVLTPIYEPVFIADSYATRVGKGTHRAIRRAQTFCASHAWYLKMDVAGFFANVNHATMLKLLGRKIKDARLLAFVERILHNGGAMGKGLPVGNLTSQFLANVYLDPLDHLVKDRWGIRGYLRYMDDFVLFGDDPMALDQGREAIEGFLIDCLQLSAKAQATCLNRTAHGLTFLGRRVFPRYLRLSSEGWRRNHRRLRQCVAAWESGIIDDGTLAGRLASLTGHRDALRRR